MPAVIQSLDIENEYQYVEKYPKILEENPETREIKPRGENYVSGILSDIKKYIRVDMQIIPEISFSLLKALKDLMTTSRSSSKRQKSHTS